MELESIEPQGWAAPKGYSNGVRVRAASELLFVAGQIAWDAQQRLVGRGDFHAQFRQALENVCAVVRAAGGEPAHIARLTIYVTDKRAYLSDLKAIGAAYRETIGRHFPAMALVQVADLLEEGAMVEIEATAALG
ncbi:RidA family protein [Engelhardtia mirabilis]|uniref:Enamine/imine deaminase n=1 Tax=Engelhardtia mirabilis TaxID=2528011 RepID=A0A518BHM3_9BACT|nr:Enamine/imine deaminase [Planctomycetes bacterium Pla133]QDV00804.1 Enamine/imine deaminase [Planctomycetes bacterium Pla86]